MIELIGQSFRWLNFITFYRACRATPRQPSRSNGVQSAMAVTAKIGLFEIARRFSSVARSTLSRLAHTIYLTIVQKQQKQVPSLQHLHNISKLYDVSGWGVLRKVIDETIPFYRVGGIDVGSDEHDFFVEFL